MEVNALYVVGQVCEKIGMAKIPAAVLLDGGNDGYSYISEELAKELPGSPRYETKVESSTARNETFVSTEFISFYLMFSDHKQPIPIKALIVPDLQYDIILCVQDLVDYDLLDFKTTKMIDYRKVKEADELNNAPA